MRFFIRAMWIGFMGILMMAGGFAAQAAVYDGVWSGTTNQGYAMQFEVQNDRVVSFTIKLVVQGSVCTVTQEGTVNKTPGDSIVNQSFTFASTVNEFSYTGTFVSSTSCSGTWEKSSEHCQAHGNGTWSATRPMTSYVPENGIWKSDDEKLSFYLQKYAAGSCIIVVTMGDGFYTAFLDTNYSDGMNVSDDVDLKGQTASLTLDSPTSGSITVNLLGYGVVSKSVSLVYEDAD